MGSTLKKSVNRVLRAEARAKAHAALMAQLVPGDRVKEGNATGYVLENNPAAEGIVIVWDQFVPGFDAYSDHEGLRLLTLRERAHSIKS